MVIYDISQEVFSCEVYPGDPKPEAEALTRMTQGELYNLSAFRMCAHNGTHIDAPFHFIEEGKTVDRLNLNALVGMAYVAEHEGIVSAGDARDILARARSHGKDSSCRDLMLECSSQEGSRSEEGKNGSCGDLMLVGSSQEGSRSQEGKNGSCGDLMLECSGQDGSRSQEDDSFRRILIRGKAEVSAEAAEVFAGAGILLIGNESQTVGPEDAPMQVHQILLRREIVILEGIRLQEVPEGRYLLCAAPLNLAGFDGAPCRAILVEV